MPCTRSQKQPTLQFPKCKSSKVMTRPKSSRHEGSENIPKVQAIPLSPRKLTLTDIRADGLSPRTFPLSPLKVGVSDPLSPLKSRVSVRTIPLSPHKTGVSVPLSPLKPSVSVPPSPLKSVRLPLSPRKRVGDENGCNLPASLAGSPPKLSRTSLGSPRKLVFGENAPVVTSPPQCISANPRLESLQKQHDKSPVSRRRDWSVTSVPDAEPKSQFQFVKQVLHTAIPERLLTRETERAAILSFLKNHVVPGRPSSLYISGAPGTGKTACLNCVLQEQKALLASVQTVVINCMTLRSSHSIFPLLTEKLGKSRNHNGKLEKLMTSSGPTVLLVLDEMDQLDSKAQDVLYTIFEWPFLPKSRLCLIGIANALDLTDRILPRLQARPHCRPKLLHFPPYSHQELVSIVQDRLLQVSGGGVLDATAVQFCARKVSAVSGDARKALDICRRAVEMVETNSRSRGASEMPSNVSAERVSVPQVARVLAEVYGDRMASSAGAEGESFPLQQKLLVCCLLLITRSGKSKDVQLGKLCEVYSKLCQQRQVSGVGQTECLSLCSLLESRGIFSLKKAKEARLTKISLKIEEKDVENALKDRTLLGSILAAGLP